MPSNKPTGPGQPANIQCAFAKVKNVWDEVMAKFGEEHGAATKNLSGQGKMDHLAETIGAGRYPLRSLRATIDKVPPPEWVALSNNTIHALCDYIGLPRHELVPQTVLETAASKGFWGVYRLYWREKKEQSWVVKSSVLELHPHETRLADTDKVAIGPGLKHQNMVLSGWVEEDQKVVQFSFHIGTDTAASPLGIPGLCLTVNAIGVPVMIAVLAVPQVVGGEECDTLILNRYFDTFKGRSLLKGIAIDQIAALADTHYRISGLFGHWFIYSANSNGIIRRGVIHICSEYDLHYKGTSHQYDNGKIEVFNRTILTLDLSNDYKHLHLIGRVGERNQLTQVERIYCTYNSTANNGSTVRAGISVMVRCPGDMAAQQRLPGTYSPDDYPADLTPNCLNYLLVSGKGGLEI